MRRWSMTGMPRTYFRNDRPPTLEEAQELVGGYIEMITLDDGSQILVDEEGVQKGLLVNTTASVLDPQHPRIVGNVVVLIGSARWTSIEGE